MILRFMWQELLFEDTSISYIENTMVRTWSNTVFGAIGINREHQQTITSPEIIQRWREKMGNIPEAEDIQFFYQSSL